MSKNELGDPATRRHVAIAPSNPVAHPTLRRSRAVFVGVALAVAVTALVAYWGWSSIGPSERAQALSAPGIARLPVGGAAPAFEPGAVPGAVFPDPAPAAVASGAEVVARDQRQSAKISRGLRAHDGGGVLVEVAPEGSIVQQLGLQRGDILLSVNNVPVNSPDDFARVYRDQGRPRQVEAVRDGHVFHRHPG